MKTRSSAVKSAPKSAAVKPASKRAARKPARATKVAPARGAAGFVRKRWNPAGDVPGLSRVRNRLPEATPDDIGELIEAVQTPHTEATLTVAPETPADPARAGELIAELSDAMAFTLDADAPADDDPQRYAKVRGFHAESASNPAAVGQDLRNHAALADSLRARLTHDDEGFDAGLIDEALALASRLMRPSLAPATSEGGAEPADAGAYALRNRLLRLLVERVALVRRCARHVFKRHPEVLQEVTSAYERERRARARKARAEKDEPGGGEAREKDAPTP